MHGAKTPGSGRTAGTPNKSTAAIRALAQEHSAHCIDVLAAMVDDALVPEETKLAAIRELLNRGHGRPAQEIALQVQTPATPLYFGWLPPDRLAQITEWLGDAKAAMERGDPRPDMLRLPPHDTTDAVLVDSEPEPSTQGPPPVGNRPKEPVTS